MADPIIFDLVTEGVSEDSPTTGVIYTIDSGCNLQMQVITDFDEDYVDSLD